MSTQAERDEQTKQTLKGLAHEAAAISGKLKQTATEGDRAAEHAVPIEKAYLHGLERALDEVNDVRSRPRR